MSKYKVSEPSALKFLKANGAVINENGNVVNDATDYWKKVYDQAEPKVAKYLHANGTIDENPGSGAGANLEDNKEIEITENGEIEITPSEGKDGMKKVTATVNVTPALETKVITAQEITNGGEITPENPNVGFDKITFPNSILADEVTFTQNGTTEFGTASYPIFPKKVIVDVPSDFIAEAVNVRPSDDPIVLDCTGKTYAVLMTWASSANGTGIATPVNNGNSYSVNVSSAGQTAGTVAWDGTNKTLTYTPNASYPMGSVNIWKVLV